MEFAMILKSPTKFDGLVRDVGLVKG